MTVSRLTRRAFIAGTAGAAAATASMWPVPLLAAPRAIKIGFTLSPDSHYMRWAKKFDDELKTRTGGAYTLQIFPQSQMGGETQMLQALRGGIQEMVISSQPAMVSTVKAFEFFDAPYLFRSIDHGNAVMASKIGQEFLDMMPASDLVGLAWGCVQERNVFSAARVVKSLDDMKGLKIRVIPSPGYVDTYKALGANPTPLPYGQLYLALKEHTVDAAENTAPQFFQDKFVELCRSFSLTRVQHSPAAITCGKPFWDTLSAKDKTAFLEAGRASAAFNAKDHSAEYQKYLGDMKAANVDLVQVDVAPWISATSEVRKRLVAIAPGGERLYDQIRNLKG